MAISKDERFTCIDYGYRRKNDRELIAVEVPKGKRDEYKAAAQELCLSLSRLVQLSVEEYIRNHINRETDKND